MTYTTQELISDAFYVSDIVSREFESVSGTQMADGLRDLNFLLDEKTVDKGMIPYITTYTFNGVVGQEDYFVTDLIEGYTLTFTIGSVRFSTSPTTRDVYFGSARANSIQSLPYEWHLEREYNGATISIYFEPNTAYPFILKGLFRLSSVTQVQDLELTLDRFYINFLTYELAETLCSKWGYMVPASVEKKLSVMRKQINKMSAPIDMSAQKTSTLSNGYSYNYAYANLGVGFVPGRSS